MRVGERTVRSVWDGSWTFPAELAYPSQTRQDWERHRTHLDADGNFQIGIGGFLVETGSRNILVDLGFGEPTSTFPQFEAKFLDNLAALGQTPEDITDVVLTHVHADHFGWASRDGRPVFTNATYRCHLKDWELYVTKGEPQPLAGPLGFPSTDATYWLGPVQDRFEHWDGDVTIAPGVDVVEAAGHTPGHTVVVVSSGEERAVLLGDVAHSPVELIEPEWQMIGDHDPELSKETRASLVREFAGTGARMAGSNFKDLRFGRIETTKGHLEWIYD